MCIDFVTSFYYSIVCVAQTVSLLFAVVVVVVVVSSQIHLTTFQVMLLSFFFLAEYFWFDCQQIIM